MVDFLRDDRGHDLEELLWLLSNHAFNDGCAMFLEGVVQRFDECLAKRVA